MRGEHMVARGITHDPEGSSPHARGAHPCRCMDSPPLGIIPACAGSTLAQRITSR